MSQRRDVDAANLALAGWSHGGWSIMDAMSEDLTLRGAAGLADAAACDRSGVKAVFLAYPYVGIAAVNRMRPWRHCPKVLAVVARADHLTTVRNAEAVHDMVRNCGAEVETWIADGSHAFDEPTSVPPMRYDAALAQEALTRFGRLLEDTAAPKITPRTRRRRAAA